MDRGGWQATVHRVVKSWTQFSSVTQSCLTLWDPRDYSMPGLLSITNSWSLLKLKSIESVMPFNHFTLVVPFSSCLQSFPTSGFFSNELVLCIRWPKYWSFSFNISPSNDIQG